MLTQIYNKKINQMHRIMKTLKKTSGMTKKMTAVFVVLVMMILTAYGQFSIHNFQLSKILLSSEFIGNSSEGVVNEESMSVEKWMTDYKSWKTTSAEKDNLFKEDTEKSLKVENWMLKTFENKSDIQVFTDPVEDNTKIESWMLNPNEWLRTKKSK